MKKDKRIYYVVAVIVTLLYYLATATDYDAVFLLFGLPIACWVVWNLSQGEEKPGK